MTRTALLAAVIAAIALLWWWSSAATAQPPPAAAAPRATAAADAFAPALGVAPNDAPVRREAAATRTAVIGHALDSGGAPLAGFQVVLQRVDEQPLNTMRLAAYFEPKRVPQSVAAATIDAAGAFAFEPLDAGEYRCGIAGVDDGAERFVLAAGEVRELALVSPLAALTGTLFRAGRVALDCFVRLDDGTTRRALPMPDQGDGTIRAFAAAGRYDVLVYSAGRHEGQGFGPCLSRHVLLVPPGLGALRWQFDTGGTEIVFAVADERGVAIDPFTAVIEGIGACDGAAGRYVVPFLPDRGARLSALPAGEWRVSLQSDVLIAEPRQLTTSEAGPRQVLSFTVARAAIVRLHLRSRPLVSPSAAARLPLRAGTREVAAKPRDRRDLEVPDPGEDTVLEYYAVPPGRAELRFEDKVEPLLPAGGLAGAADELQPLPFDPLPPLCLEVAAGQTKDVVVDVVPRATVDLVACDATGRQLPGATVGVWSGDRRVRRAADTESSRWNGWLPPGAYRVVIDRNGVRREHALRVDRSDVRERYRP